MGLEGLFEPFSVLIFFSFFLFFVFFLRFLVFFFDFLFASESELLESDSDDLSELEVESELDSGDEFLFFAFFFLSFLLVASFLTSWPQLTILASCNGLSFLSTSRSSISLTTSFPLTTWPKTT